MNIVILTGAGISAESGVPTFRGADGLWEGHRIEEVATPQAFAANPALVQEFYNLRRSFLKQVEPNPAHIALARLEQELVARGGSLLIVTQNVDDLHERGGSQNVLHMHGQLLSARCTHCDHKERRVGDIDLNEACPSCSVGVIRPDIVWFGEMPFYMEEIETALSKCDLFVSIGTSGAVYPAAGFVQMAHVLSKQTLEINLERSEGSHFFDETRLGKAGELVPKWCEGVWKVKRLNF